MWTLTVDSGSLLSVVQFNPKKAPDMAKRHGALDDDGDFLLIRARIEASLGYVVEVLDAIFSGEKEGWQKPIIDSDKTADYRFRTIVTRDEWKRFLVYEVDGISYESHVKEETVARQPEPKVGNLYTALSATWSAWAKLQPTAPYAGLPAYGSWKSKPDCKNCNHTELRHSTKGDKCNGTWDQKQRKTVACDCPKYEPKKVTPPPPAFKSAAESAKVFESGDAWEGTITVTHPAVWDGDEVVLGEVAEDSAWDGDDHADWCVFWDGDRCICPVENVELEELLSEYPSLGEDIRREVDAASKPRPSTAGSVINGVFQESAKPGETKGQKKARMARNRRARRRAAQQSR